MTPIRELGHPKLEGFDFQAYRESLIRDGSKRPCLLCGTAHPVQIHAYCKRLVRCSDGRNHQLLIVVIICGRAQRAGIPYTKRILPPFVIPECNIRLDLVLRLRQQHTANRSARGNAYALIGSVCERTIARHLRWAQEHSAATLLEVNEWVAELAPFAALPAVRVGAAGLRQLRRSVAALEAARRAGLGATGVAFTVLGCVHLRYVFERARSPLAIPSNRVLRGGCWFDTS